MISKLFKFYLIILITASLFGSLLYAEEDDEEDIEEYSSATTQSSIDDREEEIEEPDKEEWDILIGVEGGSNDLFSEKDVYVSPLVEYSRDDTEIRLQWEANIHPDRDAGAIAFSAKKEFEIGDKVQIELENENKYSFIGDDNEGQLIIEGTYNIFFFWPGLEIPFEYFPDRTVSLSPIIEMGPETDYGDFKIEFAYAYELWPERRSSEYDFLLKYELEFAEACELRIEVGYNYDFETEEKALEPEIAFSYIF